MALLRFNKNIINTDHISRVMKNDDGSYSVYGWDVNLNTTNRWTIAANLPIGLALWQWYTANSTDLTNTVPATPAAPATSPATAGS